MKHFYISVFIFIGIIAGSISSNIYAGNSINYMAEMAGGFENITELSRDEEDRISIIKNEFYANKNMLQLFINKEHIEDVEVCIILMESAIKDKDTQRLKEKSIEAVYTLRFIKENLYAFD